MDVEGETLDGGGPEAGVPVGHPAHARRGDLRHYDVPGVAIKMHARRERRCTELAFPLPCLAMTDRAIVDEQLLAGSDVLAVSLAVQRHHVVGDLLDLRRLQNAVGAETRHLRVARIGIATADTMHNRLLDCVQRSAPDPGTRGQRRVAALATATRAVAGLAVVGERDASGGL